MVNKLAPLFYSKVRAELFRLLFGLRVEKLYRADIVRLAKFNKRPFARRSVEEELQKLVNLELLVTSKEGTLRYYTANKAHPIYPELRNIVLKTVGLRDVLHDALSSQKIECAFIFGSLANLSEHAASDVDLMIVGDIGLRELTPLLREPTEKIGREINAHIFGHDELVNRVKSNDHFLREVLDKQKLFIIGDENELTKLVS